MNKQIEQLYKLRERLNIPHSIGAIEIALELEKRIEKAEWVIRFYADYCNYVYPASKYSRLTAIDEDHGCKATKYFEDKEEQ